MMSLLEIWGKLITVKPYTLLSGIQLNHAMIKDLAFTGLPDTPTGYIGYSGQYLIVSDYETGIHFTGIEKIAQDLIDYGFEVGGGSNYFYWIRRYTNRVYWLFRAILNR